jgi:Ca2+-binding RTX toxin-like protein
VVLTDFQQSPFVTPIPTAERNPGVFGDSLAGTHREEEVSVEIQIGTNKFSVVAADTTAGTFEQSWFFDPTTGLMKATVDYDHVFLLDAGGNPTSTTLGSFLAANPPSAGDTWTLIYQDNSGGNYQAREVQFEFFNHNPGDPGIAVTGNNTLPDLIYGTSGHDVLSGGGGDDIFIGRGGSDLLTGGTGADHFRYTALTDGGTIANQAGADHITDFNIAEGDVFEISASAFGGGLNVGNIAANQFGSSANDTFGSATERFHYNTSSHTLLYDSNGSDAGGTQIALAHLENAATVDAAHIKIVV